MEYNKKLVMAHIFDLICWFTLGMVVGAYCL
jgi:hypothetical protein